MPLRINGKEPESLYIGSREVQRAVLAGKTVYELLRTVTLQSDGFRWWASIPTNALCYPFKDGELRAVVFRYPVTCSARVRSWDGNGVGGYISAGAVIPTGTAVVSDIDKNYVFTRV